MSSGEIFTEADADRAQPGGWTNPPYNNSTTEEARLSATGLSKRIVNCTKTLNSRSSHCGFCSLTAWFIPAEKGRLNSISPPSKFSSVFKNYSRAQCEIASIKATVKWMRRKYFFSLHMMRYPPPPLFSYFTRRQAVGWEQLEMMWKWKGIG